MKHFRLKHLRIVLEYVIFCRENVPPTPPHVQAHAAPQFIAVEPPSPRFSPPPQPVTVMPAPSPGASSHFAAIEEAPDIRASQIMYATPSPPRITPPAVDVEDPEPFLLGGDTALPALELTLPAQKIGTPGSLPETPGYAPFPGGPPPM